MSSLKMIAVCSALVVCGLLSVSALPVPPANYRVDTHAHYIPPFYLSYMQARNITSGGRPWPAWSAAAHLSFMEAHGIKTSIISVSTPGVRLDLPGETVEAGRDLARKVNEYGAQLAATYPGKFKFLATLTLPDVEGSIVEAEYALTNLSAAGVVLQTNTFGQYLGMPAVDPLLEKLNKMNAKIFVHPNDVYGLPNIGLPSSMVDFPYETTRTVMKLLQANITGRFPNLRWSLAHSGGVLPFLAYRVAPLFQPAYTYEGVLAAMKSFYVDTALSSSDSALPSTLQFLGAGHVTFGSDYPFAPVSAIDGFVSMLDKYPLIPPHALMINRTNAEALYRL